MKLVAGDRVVWERWDYKSTWIGRITRSKVVKVGIVIEGCDGPGMALLEFHDRTREWATMRELELHTLHKWELQFDETPPYGPYEACRVCNEIRELASTQEEVKTFGCSVRLTHRRFGERTYRNVTEIHYAHRPVFDKPKVAFESDIHGTGADIYIDDVLEFETTLETERVTSF